MSFRLFGAIAAVCLVAVSVANCGSESGSSSFVDRARDSGGPPPGFVGSGDSGLQGGCKKKTCEEQNIKCGPAGDGCGGLLADCGKCQGRETCGGGGTPSVCGGNQGCVPRTCAQLGIDCGPAGDGCGGQLSCGTCSGVEICGGAGPSKCGGGQLDDAGGQLNQDGGTCVPRTAASCATGECGPVADGCGGLIQCAASCPVGEICGGGGRASFCGGTGCTITTSCAAQGANCGYVADGCGGILNCGGTTCSVPGEICGGGGPNRCGTGTDGGTGGCTTGLCRDIPTDCSGPNTPNTTSISGIVYMPNGTLPVYDALVFVPNSGTVDPLPTGIGASCDTCAAQANGVLTYTKSDARGRFTLPNMPHNGTPIPVVIQAGRWRKVVNVQTTRCANVDLGSAFPQPPAAGNTTFGSTQTSTNNIPRYAVTSGGADALQCLLRKIGIADSEFTNRSGGGRVHVYAGSGGTTRFRNGFNGLNGGARNFENETVLYGDSDANVVNITRLSEYDGVVLSCTGAGDQVTDRAGYRAEVKAFADGGGKIFASHWHHSWLEYGPAPWGNTTVPNGGLATIQHQNDLLRPITAKINRAATFPKGIALADWLVNTHTIAGTTAQPLGDLRIGNTNADGAQHTVNAVDTTRVNSWITIDAPIPQCSGDSACTTSSSNSPNPSVQYFDFNTPVGQAQQCGRFVISDLHVSRDDVGNGSGGGDSGFPNNCTSPTNPMTDQEKVLAFMLFDLTSCIQPIQPQPPTCTPQTCAQQGIVCGQAGDGCGALLTCDPCPNGQVCRGTPAQCVPTGCTPGTCPTGTCGVIADGCGGTANCGPCTAPGQVCGGSGPNQCGTNTCTPTTCVAQNIKCGPAGNGCGGVIDCGPCPAGQTCGGGGVPNECGAPNCTPRTCQQASADCGFIANGCGGSVDCGPCPAGQTCGGGGVANKCGGASGPK